MKKMDLLQGFGKSAGSARFQMLQQKQADLQRTSQQMDSMLRMQMVAETAAKRNIWKRWPFPFLLQFCS